MTAGNTFTTLDRAMEAYRLDLDNRPFVRELLANIPIREVVQTTSYLKVVRADGAPALWIFKGYTLGFESQEEVAHMADHADVWSCRRGFGIDHPVHGHASVGHPRHKVVEPTEVCPRCFTTKSLTGACFCDE